MRTSSLKAKGRRCGQETKELLHKYAPELEDADITVVPSGVVGSDLLLSPAAFKVYPFVFENKNVEKINIWAAIEQALSHVNTTKHKDAIPTVFFKRNRTELMACLRAEDFIRLYRK